MKRICGYLQFSLIPKDKSYRFPDLDPNGEAFPMVCAGGYGIIRDGEEYRFDFSTARYSHENKGDSFLYNVFMTDIDVEPFIEEWDRIHPKLLEKPDFDREGILFRTIAGAELVSEIFIDTFDEDFPGDFKIELKEFILEDIESHGVIDMMAKKRTEDCFPDWITAV